MAELRVRPSLAGILILVFLVSLSLYLVTLHRGPYPGLSAAWVNAASPEEPFPPMTHPIYSGIVRLMALLPFGTLSVRLAVLNALLGALVIVLVAYCAAAFPPLMPAYPDDDKIPRFTGLLTSILLATSFPLWFVATRPSAEPLALLLTSLSGFLLIHAERWRSTRLLKVFCLLYGMAVAEHPVALALGPLLGSAAVVTAARLIEPPPPDLLISPHVSIRDLVRLLLKMGMWTLLGVAVPTLLFVAWHAYGAPSLWRDVPGYWAALRETVIAYRLNLSAFLPRVGWLFWIATVTVPFGYVLLAGVWATRTWFIPPAFAFLHFIIAVASLCHLWLDHMAPQLSLQFSASRGSAAALSAFTLGRLAAWLRPIPEPRSIRFRRAVWRPLWLSAVRLGAVLVPLASALLGFHLLRSANRQRFTQFAEDVARFAEGRSWIVAEGEEDEIVAAVLVEKGRSTRLLRPWNSSKSPYRRYLSELFTDPRLRDLALLGVGPLLNEWMSRDATSVLPLVTLGREDFWRLCGKRPVPLGPVVAGVSWNEPVTNIERQAERNLEFAGAYEGLGEGAEREPWPMTRHWNSWVALRVSRALNNTGFLLEDHNDRDRARRAYEAALRVYPENLSALMNLSLLLETLGETPDPARQERLRAWARRSRERGMDAFAVAALYGEIRRPDLMAARGYYWAISARQRGAATAVLDLLAQEFEQMGETTLRQLAERTGDPALWLHLARVSLSQGDLVAATAYLDKADATGAPLRERRRFQALIEWMRDRSESAVNTLRDLARRDRQDHETRLLLAAIAHETGDESERERWLSELSAVLSELPHPYVLPFAQLAALSGALPIARRATDWALRRGPHDLRIVEFALRLDVLEGKREDALRRIEQLLAADAGHPLANHLLASIHLEEGRFVATEEALRTALRRVETPELYNDLAYALAGRERLQEAVAAARRAVELNPSYANGWDTLADMLLRVGRGEEAVRAARRAVELDPTDPTFISTLARAHEATGDAEAARPLWLALASRKDELPESIRDQVRRGLMAEPGASADEKIRASARGP